MGYYGGTGARTSLPVRVEVLALLHTFPGPLELERSHRPAAWIFGDAPR